jgi:hypothetical protein
VFTLEQRAAHGMRQNAWMKTMKTLQQREARGAREA